MTSLLHEIIAAGTQCIEAADDLPDTGTRLGKALLNLTDLLNRLEDEMPDMRASVDLELSRAVLEFAEFYAEGYKRFQSADSRRAVENELWSAVSERVRHTTGYEPPRPPSRVEG